MTTVAMGIATAMARTTARMNTSIIPIPDTMGLADAWGMLVSTSATHQGAGWADDLMYFAGRVIFLAIFRLSGCIHAVKRRWGGASPIRQEQDCGRTAAVCECSSFNNGGEIRHIQMLRSRTHTVCVVCSAHPLLVAGLFFEHHEREQPAVVLFKGQGVDGVVPAHGVAHVLFPRDRQHACARTDQRRSATLNKLVEHRQVTLK